MKRGFLWLGGGGGANSELRYPPSPPRILNCGWKGGGAEFLISFRSSPPPHTFKWNGPNRVSKLGFQELRVSKIPDWKSIYQYTDYIYINKLSNSMLNSSRKVFVITLKLNFLEILLGISIYKKHIPKSRVSFNLKSGIFHEPGSPKDTRTTCWLRPCIWVLRKPQVNPVGSGVNTSWQFYEHHFSDWSMFEKKS